MNDSDNFLVNEIDMTYQYNNIKIFFSLILYIITLCLLEFLNIDQKRKFYKNLPIN